MSRRKAPAVHSPEDLTSFFAHCDLLDRMVLRPLDHIASNWEAVWDGEERQYRPEEDSFASDLNDVIRSIATSARPVNYHEHEDRVVEYIRAEWPLQKEGNRWVVEDYASVLERGSWKDLGQIELIAAATGRAHTALDHGHASFDDMEWGHLVVLAGILSIIIYQRYLTGASNLTHSD